jgi:hypothetical protein
MKKRDGKRRSGERKTGRRRTGRKVVEILLDWGDIFF